MNMTVLHDVAVVSEWRLVYLSDETLFIGLPREKWMKLYGAR